ncbi:MAG: PQQ-binding-like beta-propeller repeat protein [Ktedonobacteraceae bacterium]|nr:PQQ-binding-like beta-propeller repeat protein [Ktedonobacteraceae bacterium]
MQTNANENQRNIRIQDLQEALRLGLAVVTELWSYSTIKDWISSVHAADIDGDGDIEVLVGSRNYRIYVLTKLGNLKRELSLNSEWVGAVFGIDDINATDTMPRLVVGTRGNIVYAFDATFRPLWEYNAGLVIRQIIVCDINHDGKMEVIIGSEDRQIHVLACESGELLWKYATNAWVRCVCAVDVDGDGDIELLGGSGDNYLYVLDSQGQLKWRYNAMGKIYSLAAMNAAKGDALAILVSTDAKDLYALVVDGQESEPRMRKKWSIQFDNRILSLFVVDLNQDGQMEILAGSEDKHLYVLNERGEILWKHFVGARIFSIYATDVDRDGLLEVIVGGDDNSLRTLRIELHGGERERILNCYNLLERPSLSEINLSSTESALLQILVDGKSLETRNYTLQQLAEIYHSNDHLSILAILLELENQKVQLEWQRDLGYMRAIDLQNVLNRGELEILAGTNQGYVHVLDSNGNTCWQYEFGERVRGIQAGDINHDGCVEVVAGLAGGQVYALDKTGKEVKWSSKLTDWITSLYIAPPTSSEQVGLVMGSEEKRIYIYNTFLTLPHEPIVAPQGIYAILAKDINGDGIAEIIAGAVDDNVYAYTKDGTLLWAYHTFDRVRALAVDDIDKDGHSEIIVGSEDRTVHVLNDQGNLKWRYYLPHRVLDVSVNDIDQDGRTEIVLGCGDGYMYVLNAEGEALWRYGVNDRVRIVRADDIDQDGTKEIVVGTEDQLYLLKVLNIQSLNQQIAACWKILQQKRPARDLVYEFLQDPRPVFRAFAIRTLAQQPFMFGDYTSLLQQLSKDPSPIVRGTLARTIPAFYQAYPEPVRRFFDVLASDRDGDVRLALVDSLSKLVAVNQELGFAYLDRFTRSVDMWVRRAVVRELYELAENYPQYAFRLLMITAQDDRTWVRQESARSLAHYFDLHTDNLIEGSRSLIAQGVYLDVHTLIAQQATNTIIRGIFRVMVDLFTELNEANLQTRLRDAVQAFENAKDIKYGLEIWQFYNELYHLSRINNIEEIARYKYMLDDKSSPLWLQFENTLQVLRQLTTLSNALNQYLRREGLGDRLASLYEANKTIDVIYAEVKEKVSEVVQENSQQLSDITIFRLVLKRWRAIVSAELSRLVGQAELRLTVETRSLAFEDTVSFWLTIYNDGNSPADTVTVRLLPGTDFTLVGDGAIPIELVPSRDSVQVEFTIQPLNHNPRLTFEITYDDAAEKGKVYLSGDRLDLHTIDRPYRHITNPYSVGMPIRKGDMFYGRKENLMTLKADLTNPEVNVTIVLFGQRRSGKTSILNQLVNTDVLAPHIPIYVDMQNESLGITISKFLRNIAYYIQKAMKARGVSLQPPGLKDFEDDPVFVFNCFLDEAESHLQDQKLILLIDEFEILEQKVKEKELPQEIFEYLRSLMQHHENMSFLFSGTHTIKQLTASYWSVFFNIARHYKLSALGEEAATQLIVKPVEGMLEYDPFAIQKVRRLTADQAYLIQLICRSLVDHCNTMQKNYVTINDVNTVLDAVMETGEVHFQWIWEQISQQERIVLSILAQEGGEDRRLLSPIDIEEIYTSHGLAYNHNEVLQALSGLREKDVIEISSNNTRFRVLLSLAQRWLCRTKSLRRVMLEENLLTQK